MKILVSGASGFLASALVPSLRSAGHDVRPLVRAGQHHHHGPGIEWHVATGALDEPALRDWGGGEALVHLAGENIGAGRWTKARKERIRSSRVEATERLAATLGRLGTLRVFVGASAIGYYGDRGDELLMEQSRPGAGFLAETSAAWESAVKPLRRAGVRVAHLRFGMIVSGDGGALKRMLPIFRMGLGGRVGSGNQWMSWISRHDAVRAIEFLLNEASAEGAFNAAAPNPVRNREFTKELARGLRRPAFFAVPGWALKAVYGEMAEAVLLSSLRVVPERLRKGGFQFDYPTIREAFEACVA